MSEAFLRDFANEHFEVFSAGIESTSVNPMTIKVMEELNYDLSEHYSKTLDDFIGKPEFDIVITVCAEADKNCPTILGVEQRLHWDFDNPSSFVGSDEEKLNFFRKIRDEIRTKILEWLKEWDIKPKI
jgi:arsenate reductase